MRNHSNISFFKDFWTRFRAATAGAVSLEYALLVFLIGVVLIGVLEAIGISIIDILAKATEGINSRA